MEEIFLDVINRSTLKRKKTKLSTERQTFAVARSAVREWKVVNFRFRIAADIMKILVVQ
jgi:hypothetical protein